MRSTCVRVCTIVKSAWCLCVCMRACVCVLACARVTHDASLECCCLIGTLSQRTVCRMFIAEFSLVSDQVWVSVMWAYLKRQPFTKVLITWYTYKFTPGFSILQKCCYPYLLTVHRYVLCSHGLCDDSHCSAVTLFSSRKNESVQSKLPKPFSLVNNNRWFTIPDMLRC